MIQVAIAGCGSIAQFRHAPEYAANPRAQISGVFDTVPERAQALSRQYGGKIYSCFEELLQDPEVDAVSICTANQAHAEMSILALKSGKHVLCEKPMAITLPDAQAMVDCANETGKFLMVGHNQRFIPAHVLAKKLIAQGNIGKPLTFRTTFAHPGPEAWGIDKTSNTWFFDKAAAGFGSLADLGVHKVDLVRWLLPDEITEVSAMVGTLDKRDSHGALIRVDDNAICLLRTRNGVIGTMTVSWTNYAAEDNSTIIYGSEGVMEIFCDPVWSVRVIGKNGAVACHQAGGIQTNTNQTNSGVIDAFVDGLENKEYPAISGEDALQVMRILFAMDESGRLHKAVSLKPACEKDWKGNEYA